jgi:hypothetical protein
MAQWKKIFFSALSGLCAMLDSSLASSRHSVHESVPIGMEMCREGAARRPRVSQNEHGLQCSYVLRMPKYCLLF